MAKRSSRSKRNYLKRGGSPAPTQTKRHRTLVYFASELVFDGWLPLRGADGCPVVSPKTGKPIMQRRQRCLWYLGYETGHHEVVSWGRSLLTRSSAPARSRQPAPAQETVQEWSDWSRTISRSVDKMVEGRRTVRVSANQSFVVRYRRAHYACVDRTDADQVAERCDTVVERQRWADRAFREEMGRLTRRVERLQKERLAAQQQQEREQP